MNLETNKGDQMTNQLEIIINKGKPCITYIKRNDDTVISSSIYFKDTKKANRFMQRLYHFSCVIGSKGIYKGENSTDIKTIYIIK